MASTSTSLHAALKTQTAALHKQLEANPRNAALLTDTLSMAAYERLLVRYLGFYEPLEAHLAARLAFYPKVPWLRADLTQLGYTPAALQALPRCERLPSLAQAPAAIGSLYVLEGATLGGQIITRHLRKTLPHAPIRFFQGYGSATVANWKAFLTTLETYTSHAADIIAAAKTTYRRFDAWL